MKKMDNLKHLLVVMLLIGLMSCLASCASVKHASESGESKQSVVYRRLGNQQINRLEIRKPDGTVIIMEGQQSLNDEFVNKLADGIARGIIKGVRGL